MPSTDTNNPPPPVPASQYSEEWIGETWGWDTPDEFIHSGGIHLRPRVAEALRIAELKPEMRVLDVGCGRGEVVFECARRGMSAVGVDYSDSILQIAEDARARMPEEVQNGTQFVLGDVKEISAEKQGQFDRIFMLDLVEHLHDWELMQLFSACTQLLKPDGWIVIHTLPNRWIYEFTYPAVRLFAPWLKKNPRTEREKLIHINEFSIPHLDQILRTSGFSSQVWLKEMITRQAMWHARQPLNDHRSRLYRWMCNPAFRLCYRIAARSPLRFLVTNDLWAIATLPDADSSPDHPLRGWMERLICVFSRRICPRQFVPPPETPQAASSFSAASD